MKQINTVAISVLRRRITSPSYYWMIFAPLIVGAFMLFFNNYITSNENSTSIVAVVGSDKIKNQLKSIPSKTYKISNDDVSKKNNNPGYLSEFKIDGILSINDDMSSIKYSYYSEYGGKALPDELKKNINSLHSLYSATNLGLTEKQWNDIISNVSISEKDLSTQKFSHTQTAKNFSEILIICSFFILTSYVSIVGSEIGKEKGNHLLAGILSAVSPKKHFAGKMLGISYLILFQMIIYYLIFVLLKNRIPDEYLDSLNLGNLSEISEEYILFSVSLMITSIILFILLTALFSSLVSKNEDISQVTTGVGTLVFIPYILSFVTQSNPNLALLKFLSYVPFFNQGILPIRIILNATSLLTGWVIVAINLITCLLLYKFSANIYKRNAFNYDSRNLIHKFKSFLVRQ